MFYVPNPTQGNQQIVLLVKHCCRELESAEWLAFLSETTSAALSTLEDNFGWGAAQLDLDYATRQYLTPGTGKTTYLNMHTSVFSKESVGLLSNHMEREPERKWQPLEPSSVKSGYYGCSVGNQYAPWPRSCVTSFTTNCHRKIKPIPYDCVVSDLDKFLEASYLPSSCASFDPTVACSWSCLTQKHETNLDDKRYFVGSWYCQNFNLYNLKLNPTDMRGYRLLAWLSPALEWPTGQEQIDGLGDFVRLIRHALSSVVSNVEVVLADPEVAATDYSLPDDASRLLHAHIICRGIPNYEHIRGAPLLGPCREDEFDLQGLGAEKDGQKKVAWDEDSVFAVRDFLWTRFADISAQFLKSPFPLEDPDFALKKRMLDELLLQPIPNLKHRW